MYRVDVVYEGALESTEYYENCPSSEAIDGLALWLHRQIDANIQWSIELYDERPYPPELVYRRTNVKG